MCIDANLFFSNTKAMVQFYDHRLKLIALLLTALQRNIFWHGIWSYWNLIYNSRIILEPSEKVKVFEIDSFLIQVDIEASELVIRWSRHTPTFGLGLYNYISDSVCDESTLCRVAVDIVAIVCWSAGLIS